MKANCIAILLSFNGLEGHLSVILKNQVYRPLKQQFTQQ